MAWVIVAGVLGSITICGGLFLRRLLGEITELRRQITRVDRQMRAQRARESFLRQLISYEDEDEDGDDGPPVRAAIASGHDIAPGSRPPTGLQLARTKGHLGLIIGGAAAAIASFGHAARDAARTHQGALVAAVTGAGVTAAAVTLVTVQPWRQDASHEPPSSAPTVLPTEHIPPSATHPPATTRRPTRTRTPSATASGPDASASAAPGLSPPATFTVIPADETTRPAPGTSTGAGAGPPPAGDGTFPPGGQTSTGGGPPGRPPSSTPPATPPATGPASSGLCLDINVPPVLGVGVCLLGG